MSGNGLSPLHGNRATLQLTRFPETTISITGFRVPGLNMGPAFFSTPYRDASIAGDKIEWEPLDLTFIVDSDLANWLELYDWFVSLGAPEDRLHQYQQHLKDIDASIIIYNPQNNPVLTVKFKHCVPISLGGLDFSEEESETNPITSTLVLEYENYEIAR